MFDWNDVRHFLAVARSGSTLTASRELKLSQPTVARRIAALEEGMGVSLFERRQQGYRLTEDGEALVPQAEAMERCALALAEGAQARTRRVSGVVRLTCAELVATHHLTAMLAEFGKAYPDVRVDVVVTDKYVDLAGGEADVALRGTIGPLPEAPGLVCRKLLDVPWVVACSRAYGGANGKPGSESELAGHAVIGADGPLAAMPAMRWLEEATPPVTFATRANSLIGILSMVRAGAGISALPASLMSAEPDLVECFRLPRDHDGQFWLVAHESVRHQPRVRALMDFMPAYIAARRTLAAEASGAASV